MSVLLEAAIMAFVGALVGGAAAFITDTIARHRAKAGTQAFEIRTQDGKKLITMELGRYMSRDEKNAALTRLRELGRNQAQHS